MNILIQGRSDLDIFPGGDLTFIQGLKRFLEKTGHAVRVSKSLISNLASFDIIHLVGIMRAHEMYFHARHAKELKKRIFLTPIYEDLEEWNNKGRYGVLSPLYTLIKKKEVREIIKTALIAIGNPEQVKAALVQLGMGFSNQQKYILDTADEVIPSSEMERNAIAKDFGKNRNFTVIPNAVENVYQQADPLLFEKTYRKKNFVLSVGRIESKKNQLALIQALTHEPIDLVFIGKENKKNKRYVSLFKKECQLNKRILYLSYVPQEMLSSAYAASKVHVLPSWFEITGLVSLEAGLAGANIVTTDRGYAKEYLKNLAWYCDPSSLESIRTTVMQAYHSPKTEALRRHLVTKYTWEIIGPRFLELYYLWQNTPPYAARSVKEVYREQEK